VKSFIREIKKEDEQSKTILKKHYLCFDKTTDEYLNDFKSALKKCEGADSLFIEGNLEENERIDGIEVLRELPAGKIANASKNHYLHMFYLLAKLHTGALENTDDARTTASLKAILVSVLKILNGGYDTDEILDEVFDDEYRTLMSHVANSKIAEDEPPSMGDGAPFDMGSINQTKIGKLAQEISSQIDMSALNTNKVSNINDLFSGENSAMSSIISQVSSVMSQKMQSGELNQEELMSEAFSMMGNMQNNDMMASMMQNMQQQQQAE
tara:strand:+ start:5925 stop:6728 length:804 start_codon:yes stop_codon:yes gene_type:complete